MRRMSFALTLPQMRAGTKTVTRRRGWDFLKPGDRVLAVDKVMGFRLGERAEVLGEIEVISVRREHLYRITDEEVAREGFPGMSPEEFVALFCQAMECRASDTVTRIEFRMRGAEPEWAQLARMANRYKRASRRRELAERAREKFNSSVPLGSKVLYWPGLREGEGTTAETRSEAVLMSDHASVWVTGYASSISLTHIEVIQ